MTTDELQDVLEHGDGDACVQYFEGRSDKERSSVSKLCADRFRKLRRKHQQQQGKLTEEESRRMQVAQIAVTAACSISDLIRFGWDGRPQLDYLVRVFRDRRPRGLSRYVDRILEEEWFWYQWPVVRALVREGLCPKPRHPHYILALIGGLAFESGSGKAAAAALRADPGLLDEEVWEIFEHDNSGDTGLANNPGWAEGLCLLAKSGDLSRDRLLDCTLDALQRDFNQNLARWHTGLHDALQPSAAERHARIDRYLGLLACKTPTPVSWAFTVVESLDKQEPPDATKLAEALRPVLRSRQKGIVKKALKLLDRIAKREPLISMRMAITACEGLAHEAIDVQEASLKSIEKHGDKSDGELRAAIARFADGAAPSVRAQLAGWDTDADRSLQTPDVCETDESTSDLDAVEARVGQLDPKLGKTAGVNALVEALKSNAGTIPAATFDGTEFPRLDPERRLEPIRDLDELFDVCARVLEEPTLVDEAERAFQGFSRLCDQRTDRSLRLISPVLKRAIQKLERFAVPFAGLGPENDIGGLVIAWGRAQVLWPRLERDGQTVGVELDGDFHSTRNTQWDRVLGFLSRRSLALAERVVAGNAMPLLSAPTHERGWIDPADFVRRANEWIKEKQTPDPHDVCLALLRLAPERRDEALADLARGPDEWLAAIRHALGAARVSIGPTAALWACAARSRSVWSDDERIEKAHPQLGPDVGTAASYSLASKTETGKCGIWRRVWVISDPPVPKEPNRDLLTVQLHLRRDGDKNAFIDAIGGDSASAVRWVATVWPLGMEAYFAAAAAELSKNLDFEGAYWWNREYLEPLIDPDVPVRAMAATALAIGLDAKEPGEHGLAIDAAIAAIKDGRLNDVNLGSTVAALLPTGHFKAARWAKALAEVASISPLHSFVTRRSIERGLRGDRDDAPRDIHALLTLFHELCVAAGDAVRDRECRTFLEQFTGSAKAAKSARALLKLERDDKKADAQYHAAAASSLANRLDRIATWERRLGLIHPVFGPSTPLAWQLPLRPPDARLRPRAS